MHVYKVLKEIAYWFALIFVIYVVYKFNLIIEKDPYILKPVVLCPPYSYYANELCSWRDLLFGNLSKCKNPYQIFYAVDTSLNISNTSDYYENKIKEK